MSQNPTPSAALFQLFAVSGQMSMPNGNLARSGPVDRAMFYFWSDVSVSYQLATGGATYTDTVRALTAARVYATQTTTVDLRASRYVVFIEPQRGGVAPLLVAPEGYYNFLAQQGYVIPLFYATWDQWTIYQGTSGLALPPPGGSIRGGGSYGTFTSQAIKGGGSYGTFTSQAIKGGGSVPGITYRISAPHAQPYGASPPGSVWGFFLKVPAAPANKTTLVDWNFGSAGYLRLTLTPSLTVHLEFSILGAVADIDVTAGVAIPTGQYLWVSMANNRGAAFDSNWYVHVKITKPGGVTVVDYANSGYFPTSNIPDTSYTATLGWGVSQSSTYDNFPVTAGWAMSKFHYDPAGSGANDGANVFAPPSTDWGAGAGPTYNCRDGLGAVTTLLDNSGGTANLTPGPQGLTVVADGPYA